MKAGIFCRAVAVAGVFTLAGGCGPDIDFDTDPYLVGDRGNLRFLVAGVCGFDEVCSPESGGIHLDAEELGLSTAIAVHANAAELTVMPQLEFQSEEPDIFVVRAARCQNLMDAGSAVLEPCPVESPAVYSVDLDLRSEGRADLVARLASDGSVYDRGTVRVRPPRCDDPDSVDPVCIE